jgi:hypothetical protein
MGAGHPWWMDCGEWLCVFFPTPPVGEAQRKTVCEIVTLTQCSPFSSIRPVAAVIVHINSNLLM